VSCSNAISIISLGISAIDCCLTPSGHFEEGSHTPVESMEQSDATSSICEASNMMEDAPYEDSCATEHTEMQLDMVAAIFLATLKEKYKVMNDNEYRISCNLLMYVVACIVVKANSCSS